MLTPDRSNPDRSTADPAALVACLMEIDRHIAGAGWEQQPRLFALAPTAALAEAEPAAVPATGTDPDAPAGQLSAIEQDGFDGSADVLAALQAVMWPEPVTGCAVSVVRSFLPAGADAAVPDDPAAAEQYVQQHPGREDVRAVVGVLRDGTGHVVARLAGHPDDLLSAPELLPGVLRALHHTFDPEPGDPGAG